MVANCSRLLISLLSSSKTDSGVAMVCLVTTGVATTDAATTGMLEIDVEVVLVVDSAPATTGVVIVVVMLAGAIEVGVAFCATGQPLGKRATATPG